MTRSGQRGGSQGVEAVAEPPVPVSALIDPIVDAKLHPPQPRPDWITRPRLLQELEEAVLRYTLGQRKSGSGGGGKLTPPGPPSGPPSGPTSEP